MQRLWQSLVRVFSALSPARRRLAFIAAIFFALCALTIFTTNRANMVMPNKPPISSSILKENQAVTIAESDPFTDINRDLRAERSIGSRPTEQLPYTPPAPGEPRIAYSAELGVVTKDFSHARSSMEDILERHRGYAARLRMVGHSAGGALTATLKVPASEYPAALTDLKSVGNVEKDEEAADEIIQQRGDIEARLQNAQNEERKLQLLLKDRDVKVIDLASLERQLAALHNDIVQMEIRRHSFDSRVVFSNIHFSLREEHDAPVESVSAQLRRAAGSGLSDAVHALSTVLIIIISYGPSFLLWAAILFFPARYLWRRFHVSLAGDAA